MRIGLITASMSIPEARSLKDKLSVLRSLKDRMMNKMNVSVAEVGRQDEWKFSELAVVTVAAESKIVQSGEGSEDQKYMSDRILASDKVLFVGHPIAAVAAQRISEEPIS